MDIPPMIFQSFPPLNQVWVTRTTYEFMRPDRAGDRIMAESVEISLDDLMPQIWKGVSAWYAWPIEEIVPE